MNYEVRDIVQETEIKTIPMEKKCKKESCGTYTQWSITQPLKRIHLNQF